MNSADANDVLASSAASVPSTGWNFDVTAAPKSFHTTRQRVIGGKTQDLHDVEDVFIIAAIPGPGRKVGRTRWLPDVERWEGMTKGQQPVAWMPWPEYPAGAA